MNACRVPQRSNRFIECRSCSGTLDVVVPGWRDIQHGCGMEVWQNVDGDYLGLVRTLSDLGLPELTDEAAVRRHCRALAERMESGLVEAGVVGHVEGRAVAFIGKRPEPPAFRYTAVLIVPTPRATWVWTTCAKEQGATDVREVSDEECHEAQFPDHPLTKVRRELRNLLTVRLSD